MKMILQLIDEALAEYAHREVVTAREHNDILLDLRLACTTMLEQQKGTDAELSQGVEALVGVGDTDTG